MRDERLLKELTQLMGVSGFEKNVRERIEQEAKPYADEIYTDAIGNLIVLKKGNGGENSKKIMYAAHTDEIGFIVKKIEADGRLRVANMGWNWALELVNDRICAKTLDNRIGCYQLLMALKENDGSYPNDVYYVFCVQEELGCRGSKPTAARIKPDIGIAVDITPAHDYPCDLEGSNEVDGGIGIKICDPSVVCDEDVVAAMEKACEDNHIKYQREVIDKGGTDASSMNLSGYGVKAGGIVVTTRYPHSQSAVASKADIEAGVDLMTAFSKTEFTF